jgi:hypothetical protein
MTASTALRPSARAAFAALIDYAGLFPPAELPIAQALDEYEAARHGPHAWMLGRFIVPASLLRRPGSAIEGPLSVIVDGGFDSLRGVAALGQRGRAIEALEIPLAADASAQLRSEIERAKLGGLPCFVEIPRSEHRREVLALAMSALADAGLGAKLRCGGRTADAFPNVDEVADFIAAACQARVPFKATAGLHHPVRHLDPSSGFTMHGFLNILAAAALAPRFAPETLTQIVAEEDPKAFALDDASFSWKNERIDIAQLAATRRERFVSYGSCSFAEPVEDLTALGFLSSQ